MARTVFDLIHKVDPYEGLDHACYPEDLRGWWSNDGTFDVILELQRPRLIVEVGVWKGASAIHMAEACRQFKIAAEIVCVDPQVGSAGTWLHDHQALGLHHGSSTVYETFLANVIRKELTDIITPFRATSSVAAEVFKRSNVRPDLVYIDGSHLARDVANDLTGFAEILPENGVFLCDDYKHSRIPGVTEGVQAFLAGHDGFSIIEAVPTGTATEWVAADDTFLKCFILRNTNPLLPALRARFAPHNT